jgi:sugar lactone lactonase YvrE
VFQAALVLLARFSRKTAVPCLMLTIASTAMRAEFPINWTSIGISTTSDRVEAVAMDIAGNIYSIQDDGAIDKWPADGTKHTHLDIPRILITHSRGIAVDDLGDLYFSDTDHGLVIKMDAQQNTTIIRGFSSPMGMAGTASGVIVTDSGDNVIKVIDGSNQVTTVASGLDSPVDIARDRVHNKFYYALEHGDAAGIYSVNGYDFDHANAITGGVPLSGKFQAVGVDGQGNVYYRQTQGSLQEIPFGSTESIGAGGDTGESGIIGNSIGAGYIGYFQSTRENLGDTPNILKVTPGLALPSAAVCPNNTNDTYSCQVPVQVFFNIPEGGGGEFNGSVTISADSVTQSDFTFTKVTCSLFGDGCFSVNFLFAPKAPGLRRAAISIRDNDLNTTNVTHIAGSAFAPIATFPTTARSLVRFQTYLNGSAPVMDLVNNLYYDNGFCINKVASSVSTNQIALNCQSNFSGWEPSNLAVDEIADVVYTLPLLNAIAGSGPRYPNGLYLPGVENPTGIAFDTDGGLLFSEYKKNQVSKYSFSDRSRTVIATDLKGPEGLAIDTAGTIYIADSGNSRIVKIPKSGPTVSITKDFSYPLNVAVDVAGNIFISDSDRKKTLELPVDGSQDVVLESDLRQPDQVAVGWNGDVYVADGNILSSYLYRLQRSQPQPIQFNITAIGTRSSDSPHLLSISNGGNAPMTISSFNSDNADFTVAGTDEGTTCVLGTPLAAGQTCQVGINYQPLLLNRQGTSTASLIVADDSLYTPSTQIVQLTGTFVVPPLLDPKLSFSPASGKVSFYSTPLYLDARTLSPTAVTFKVISGPANLNQDKAGQHYLTFSYFGTVVIEADQPATDVYTAGSTQNTLLVALPGRLLSLQATSPTQKTLAPGGASFTFLLSPELETLLDSVQLSLEGLPAWLTYTITPSQIKAGSGPTTITLNIANSSRLAAHSNTRLSGILLGMLIIPFSLVRSVRGRVGYHRMSRVLGITFFLFLLGGALAMSGCSSHSDAQTYAITLNAVSDGLTAKTTVFVLIP